MSDSVATPTPVTTDPSAITPPPAPIASPEHPTPVPDAPVEPPDLSTLFVGSASLQLRSNEPLVIEMLGREYDNFNQSSFHSDGLRNQIIQFYLIIVGAAATAIVGIAQLQAGNGNAAPLANQALWPFSAVAFFIGLIGIVMLPIFVRLRRVVLECLAGTVLIKRYVERHAIKAGDTVFGSAMLWDARSLPLDENYFTASFVLVFVVMLLSSVMVALAVFLRLYEGLRAANQDAYAAAIWSFAILFTVLTLQVLSYRLWLWYEIRKFIRNDQLREKWAALHITTVPVRNPARWRPLFEALLVFAIPAVYFMWSADGWLPIAEMWRLVTNGL